MKKLALLSLLALLFFTTLANADTLFYGGDFDPNNPYCYGLPNETDWIVGGDPYGAATYQNFTNSQAWTVTGLFTNNFSTLAARIGYWEIRSGVSEGNGGTLIASGTASGGDFTHTPTGRSGFNYNEYQDMVSGVNVFLNPGTYWLAVVPYDVPVTARGAGLDRSFNSSTFGLNSVGTQTSHLQYFNSAFFGVYFTNADNEGPEYFATFSSGVIGSVGVLEPIPEPSSLIMLGSGLLAVAGVIRRRLSP